MAVPGGRQDPSLVSAARAGADEQVGVADLLVREPYRFGFFQAVRILHRLYSDRQAIGQDAVPAAEVVRFRAQLSLVFPPSEIVDFVPENDAPPSLTVAFLGLTGPSGALPRHYTELLLERKRQKDSTLRDFLDLFNHRLISLFYLTWEKYRFWIGCERAELAERKKRAAGPQHLRSFVFDERPRLDPFSQRLLDLAGFGPPALRYRSTVREELRPRSEIADATLRFYCGLFSQQHRSAIGLEGLLSHYFGLSVVIRQFCSQWLQLESEDQTCLRADGNSRLGVNAVIGDRFRDSQGKFRIRLGPLNYRQFREFLPLGGAFRPLAQLARLYGGQQFDIDVQLVLQANEVPRCRLHDSQDAGARLGWDTWLRGDNLKSDAEDAVFAVYDQTSA